MAVPYSTLSSPEHAGMEVADLTRYLELDAELSDLSAAAIIEGRVPPERLAGQFVESTMYPKSPVVLVRLLLAAALVSREEIMAVRARLHLNR